ncbi:unnamed protein product [Lampetra fluviatilis]
MRLPLVSSGAARGPGSAGSSTTSRLADSALHREVEVCFENVEIPLFTSTVVTAPPPCPHVRVCRPRTRCQYWAAACDECVWTAKGRAKEPHRFVHRDTASSPALRVIPAAAVQLFALAWAQLLACTRKRLPLRSRSARSDLDRPIESGASRAKATGLDASAARMTLVPVGGYRAADSRVTFALNTPPPGINRGGREARTAHLCNSREMRSPLGHVAALKLPAAHAAAEPNRAGTRRGCVTAGSHAGVAGVGGAGVRGPGWACEGTTI